MSPVLKILAGALMMVLGVFTSITYVNQLVNIVQGGIGPLLILVGAFIVWLESDELKVRSQQKDTDSTEEFQTQQTLDETSEEETREAAREIKQAVSSSDGDSSTGVEHLVKESTVQEVKEAVREGEDLDTREVLEAEKKHKNRKTLVNYLERRLD